MDANIESAWRSNVLFEHRFSPKNRIPFLARRSEPRTGPQTVVRLAIRWRYFTPLIMLKEWIKSARQKHKTRKLGWLLATIIVIFSIFALAHATLKSRFSSDSIKTKLESEFSSLTGNQVHINGQLEVSFFPGFQIRTTDVLTLNQTGPVSFSAPILEARLSIFQALRGIIAINEIHLDGAKILVTRTTVGIPNDPHQPVNAAVTKSALSSSENSQTHDVKSLGNNFFGSILLTNSSLQLLDANGQREEYSQINGTFSWAELKSSAIINGSLMWHDETIEVRVTIASPVILLASGFSDLDFSFKSPTLNFQFQGKTNSALMATADGRITAEIPSLERFMTWSKANIIAGEAIGALTIDSKLTTDQGKMKFDNLVLSLSGSEGTGALEVDPELSPPKISGTLAFGRVDLKSIAEAFSLNSRGMVRQNFSFLNQLDLDLRISANAGIAGNLTISDPAGAIRITNGNADFDIGDGKFAGGNLKASLRLSGPEAFKIAHLNVALLGFSQDQLPGISPVIPTLGAPIDGFIDLEGTFSSLEAIFINGSGKFSIKSGVGMVRNFNSESFVSSLQSEKLFALPTLYSGITLLQSLTIDGTINDAVVIVDAGEMVLADKRLVVAGALPFTSGGVAMNGVITNDNISNGPELIPFFLGGAWKEPYVTIMTKTNP